MSANVARFCLAWVIAIGGTGFVPHALGAAPLAGEPLADGAIVRCTEGGRTTYSTAPCARGHGRDVNVTTSSGFAPPAVRPGASDPPAPAAPEATSPPAAPAQAGPDAKLSQCRDLDEAIAGNEAAARRPQPGWRQDELTAHKRVLQAKRNELGC